MVSLLGISALLLSVLEVAALPSDHFSPHSIVRRARAMRGLMLRHRHSDEVVAVSPTGRVEARKSFSSFLPGFGDTCTDSQIGGNYQDSAKNQVFVLSQTDCEVSFGFGVKAADGTPITHTGAVSKNDTTGAITVTVDDWDSITGEVQSNGDVQFSDANGEATRRWVKQQASKPKTAASAKDPAATDTTATDATATDATAATTPAPVATGDPTAVPADPGAAATNAAATAATTLIPYQVPVATTPPNSAWWTTTLLVEWAAVPLVTEAPPSDATTATTDTATADTATADTGTTTAAPAADGGGVSSWFW